MNIDALQNWEIGFGHFLLVAALSTCAAYLLSRIIPFSQRFWLRLELEDRRCTTVGWAWDMRREPVSKPKLFWGWIAKNAMNFMGKYWLGHTRSVIGRTRLQLDLTPGEHLPVMSVFYLMSLGSIGFIKHCLRKASRTPQDTASMASESS